MTSSGEIDFFDSLSKAKCFCGRSIPEAAIRKVIDEKRLLACTSCGRLITVAMAIGCSRGKGGGCKHMIVLESVLKKGAANG